MIANGLSIDDSVKEAQQYTWQALRAGFRPGMGQHIPDRFFWANEQEDSDRDDENATPTIENNAD